MFNTESRTRMGCTQYLLHRRNGETAFIDAGDVTRTLRSHPDEWALEAWSAADQREALKTMPLTDLSQANSTGPFF